ncbi:hypothetical protein ABZ682_12230 [Streptomyces griseoviridis]|uniref:Uncharacterized protein n=1 Tax=Streptomyces hintoniae TaxID=3075521 RepID=A0ABU2UUE1_9ACTN|nr:hypothetical protein [Streptomyces sp. DSM 41014]MDT0476887.1 hypothetical protein [Streptomyces sp. DSM 41014]
MSNLKIAIEAADVAGLTRRGNEADQTIHAYDVDEHEFPFHTPTGEDVIIYDVRTDVDWPAPQMGAKKCPACELGTKG